MPGTKVIHLKRDPAAVCWSNYKQYFPDENIGFIYDLDDLVEYYCLYDSLMKYWHKLFPASIYELDYELLTQNPEVEIRKLLEYCDLDWQADCLHFETKVQSVRTASRLQVRKGIYQGSSAAWRQYEEHLEILKHFPCHIHTEKC